MKIMNTNKRRLAKVLGVLVALCLVGSLVTTPVLVAVPEMDHQFYGGVTSQGDPVDEGVSVVAKIDGEPCASTTVDADSNYGWVPEFLVLAEDASAGDPIKFYIDGDEASLYDVEAGVSLDSYPFENGGYTELNLTVGEVLDTIPPMVVSTIPEPNATNQAINVVVSATFDEDIQEDANFGGVTISEATGVSATIDGATLTIAHDAFTYEASYTVTIPAGAVKDLADNPLAEAKVWSFTVVTEEEVFDPYIYDTDGDGVMSKDETLAAVDDYLADPPVITKNDVLAVVKLYFS